jgi:hypothetical protein
MKVFHKTSHHGSHHGHASNSPAIPIAIALAVSLTVIAAIFVAVTMKRIRKEKSQLLTPPQNGGTPQCLDHASASSSYSVKPVDNRIPVLVRNDEP